MTTPLEALTAKVSLQAARIQELERQLVDEHQQYELWKFRAVENGRSTKRYKKQYLELLENTTK